MSDPDIAPEAPRREQTLELGEARLDALEPWGTDGTALAAAVRARDPEGRVALVRNRWSDGWILPGGGVEPGETPQAAARREFREETGVSVTLEGVLVVLDQRYRSMETGSERFRAEYVVFAGSTAAAAIADAAALGTDADEIRAAEWFEEPPDEL